MNIHDELKKEFSILMHEIIIKSRKMVENGEYSNLITLCDRDITILSCIKSKEDITAREISLLLSVPKTTIVSAVSRLDSRGYLIKVENEKDKREKFLRLTEKGIKTNNEHENYENIILDSLAGLWKQPNKEKLIELLQCREELK